MTLNDFLDMIRNWRRTNPDDDRLWDQLVKSKGCIKCDVKPKAFYEGPAGGACVNVFCSHCGQGYNLTPVVRKAELIHKDVRYIKK